MNHHHSKTNVHKVHEHFKQIHSFWAVIYNDMYLRDDVFLHFLSTCRQDMNE